MSYSIYRTNGSLLTNIPDGTVNTTSTSLSLPGRNFASYGQIVDTNFVHQLENFAANTPPNNAMRGQLWYNTTPSSEGLYVCPVDGTTDPNLWVPVLTPDNVGNLTVDNLESLGNITANNASITNNANANVISTNYLTVNVQANMANANVTGNAVIANLQTVNVTTGSNSIAGTLTGAWSVNGDATINSVANTALYVFGGNLVLDAGIKTDDYYYANGVPVSFAGTYSNSNVELYLPTYTGTVGTGDILNIFNGRTLTTGSSATTGTITGNWTLSPGSQINGLSGISGANVTGTVANATYAVSAGTAGSATTAATVTTNAQPNITSVGTLTGLDVSGNATFTGQLISLGSNGNVRITGGSPGQVLSTNGSGGLSWVSAAAADTAITVTANAQPNITSMGTLTELNVSGNASFTGANVSLGAADNLKIAGGTAGQLLASLGSGNVTWQTPETVFPSGTRMLFVQTTAPAGWVKDTSTDNAALRVVSGSAGSGGSVNFTSAFTSQAVNGSVGSTTAGGSISSTTITAEISNTAVGGSIGTTTVDGAIGTNTISANIGSTSVTGVVGDTTAGGTVGATALTTSQIPSHTHSITDPGHSHTIVDPGHSHEYTQYLIKQRGDDNNDFLAYNATYQAGTSTATTGISVNGATTGISIGNTGSGQAHSHTFSGTSHNHSFSSASHTHTFNQTAHGHTFSSSPHSHSFSSPSHSHDFTQTAHTHNFTGTSHNHTFSGTAINLAVKYVDTIIATKS